jgi:hypothetical protein
MKPTDEDKRDGLKPKYQISRADGTPCDPTAQYFVLRLDYHDGCDEKHIDACRVAAMHYAVWVRNHLPQLSADLLSIVGSVPDAWVLERARDNDNLKAMAHAVLPISSDGKQATFLDEMGRQRHYEEP